jgi:hypothetical protein
MEISLITKKYWQENDWENLKKANSITDLFYIAEEVLKRIPKPVAQVCGPISTGGVGSLEANLNIFNQTIKDLQNKGLNIFDQMPFEEKMKEIKEKIIKSNQEYSQEIIHDFYEPLFSLGMIKTFYFIPGWESSTGANMEHDLAFKYNIEIKYL